MAGTGSASARLRDRLSAGAARAPRRPRQPSPARTASTSTGRGPSREDPIQDVGPVDLELGDPGGRALTQPPGRIAVLVEAVHRLGERPWLGFADETAGAILDELEDATGIGRRQDRLRRMRGL